MPPPPSPTKDMNDIEDFTKMGASRLGFSRDHYVSRNILDFLVKTEHPRFFSEDPHFSSKDPCFSGKHPCFSGEVWKSSSYLSIWKPSPSSNLKTHPIVVARFSGRSTTFFAQVCSSGQASPTTDFKWCFGVRSGSFLNEDIKREKEKGSWGSEWENLSFDPV